MGRKTKSTEPPALVTFPALGDTAVPVTLTEARAWLEDKVVRGVRAAGYCREADRVMRLAFPEGPLNGDHFVDSDGLNAWGDGWRDADGYDRNGFEVNGYDRDGYNRDGYDRNGFNREGLDSNGVTRTDPSRWKYNRNGRDRDGYDVRGLNEHGRTREQQEAVGAALEEYRYGFGVDGYDITGHDSYGYNRQGDFTRGADGNLERWRCPDSRDFDPARIVAERNALMTPPETAEVTAS